jgi:hypothetical protein
VQSPSPIEPDDLDPPFNAMPHVIPPAVPTVVLPPTPGLARVSPPLLQSGNIWSVTTNLIFGDDGRPRQSSQRVGIDTCISKAIRLANSNIFFTDAFPNLQVQNEWLSKSLIAVLRDQARMDPVIREVNLRAQQDDGYMSALISMVRYRFSSLILSAWFLNPIR